MSTITGWLSDIGLQPLAGLMPVLRFFPSAPGVRVDGRVFASKPVEVVPASDGSFSVELASTADVLPRGVHWKMSAHFHGRTADNKGYPATDPLDFKLFVTGDGNIGDLIGSYTPNDLVYVGTDAPNPAMSAYQFQFNPATGNLYGRQG